MRDRSEKPKSEQIGRRNRALARSLRGRVFVSGTEVYRVRGRPRANRLVQCLSALTGVPALGRGPGLAALGFASGDAVPVSREMLSSCGLALQKWRRLAAIVANSPRRKAEMRKKRKAWSEEIPLVARQLELLHRTLDRVESGREVDGAPLVLSAEAEADCRAALAEAVGGRRLPTLWRWLGRVVWWLDGPEPLGRFLASLRPFLETEEDYHQREAIHVFQREVERLRRWFQRQGDPLDAWLDKGRSYEECAAAASQIAAGIREVDASVEEHVYLAVDRLPDELAEHFLDLLPRRARDLAAGHFERLRKRSEEVLDELGKIPSPRAVGGLAALCICDGIEITYPENVVLALDKPEDHPLCRRLAEQVGLPGYTVMVRVIAGMDKPESGRLELIQELAKTGASPRDVAWAVERGLAPDFIDATLSPEPLRRLTEHLSAAGVRPNDEQLESLAEVVCADRAGAVPAAFVRWIDLLPPGVFDRAMAETVKNTVMTAAVPGALQEGLRALLARWSRPRGPVPQTAGLPDGLPDEARKWIRRIAFYQHFAGEPVSLPKSLRRQLDAGERAGRELRYLEQAASAGPLPPGMAERLAHLRSKPPDSFSVDRAKLTEQAKEVSAKTALDAIIKVVRCRAEEAWTAEFGPVPPYLASSHLVDLLHWKHSLEEGPAAAVDELIAAWGEHGPRYRLALKANGPWLARAVRAGVDVEAWLGPGPETVSVDGKDVRLELARDPFLVFLMGSYFDTCLSARCGVNRDAILANACHANKAVLYARSPEGQPWARRLVCLNEQFQMIRFDNYCSAEFGRPEDWEAAMDAFCGRWARAAGVELAEFGTPENLDGHFWYDDGLHPWSDDAHRAWWGAEDGPRPAAVHAVFRDRVDDALALLEGLGLRIAGEDEPRERLLREPALLEEALAIVARRRGDRDLARKVFANARFPGGRLEGLTSVVRLEGEAVIDDAVSHAEHIPGMFNRLGRILAEIGTPRSVRKLLGLSVANREGCDDPEIDYVWLWIALRRSPEASRAFFEHLGHLRPWRGCYHGPATAEWFAVFQEAIRHVPAQARARAVRQFTRFLFRLDWPPWQFGVEHLGCSEAAADAASRSLWSKFAQGRPDEHPEAMRARLATVGLLALANPGPGSTRALRRAAEQTPALLPLLGLAAPKRFAPWIAKKAQTWLDHPAALVALMFTDDSQKTDEWLSGAREPVVSADALREARKCFGQFRRWLDPASDQRGPWLERWPEDCVGALRWALKRRVDHLLAGRWKDGTWPEAGFPGLEEAAWRLADALATAGPAQADVFRRHLRELLPAVADKYPSGRYPSRRKFSQMVLILEQISAGRLFQEPELPSLDRVLRFDELPVGLDQFVLDDGPFLSKLPGLSWPSPEDGVMVTIDSLPEEPERSGKLLRLLAAKWPPDKLQPESDLTAIQRLLVNREKQAAVK